MDRTRKTKVLFSRGGRDWSGQLPAVVEATRALAVTSVTLDGEVVDVTRITFLYPAAR
jgi:ATP-dependent DNA ligase